ncbi:MAG: hypothetical protein M1469_06955 [Bacteroidetes bacterium]|nr:hypothetical protein [Bacteroidota bacterium]
MKKILEIEYSFRHREFMLGSKGLDDREIIERGMRVVKVYGKTNPYIRNVNALIAVCGLFNHTIRRQSWKALTTCCW